MSLSDLEDVCLTASRIHKITV